MDGREVLGVGYARRFERGALEEPGWRCRWFNGDSEACLKRAGRMLCQFSLLTTLALRVSRASAEAAF